MANILVTHKSPKGETKPIGSFTQKQKVWDYIESALNEDYTMRVFPNATKEYKINKANVSRLLKDTDGFVLREDGKVRYVVLNIDQNPER